MAVPSDLPALEARAREHEAKRDWASAAGAWASIAEALGRGGDAERAARAWDAAGEAWRRDDRPALADKALRTALALTQEPGLVAIVRVKRSGCLVAQGHIADARSTLLQAMMGPNHVQAVVADGLVDLALVQADVPAAATWAARIHGEEDVVAATRGYRLAQVARLTGELDTALAGLEAAAGALPGAAGKAAIMGEQAEVYALQGDAHAALDARRQALVLHAHERRLGPQASALAALVRTAVEGGVTLTHVPGIAPETPLPSALQQTEMAMEKSGLVLVALDLRIARALLDGDAAALRQASADAAALGAIFRSGRALGVGVLTGLLGDEEAAQARQQLAKVPVWMARLA